MSQWCEVVDPSSMVREQTQSGKTGNESLPDKPYRSIMFFTPLGSSVRFDFASCFFINILTLLEVCRGMPHMAAQAVDCASSRMVFSQTI